MESARLLLDLGLNVRAKRLERGWTIRALADRCGLSPRFLVQVEAGTGNISVRRLNELAAALHTDPARLLQARDERRIVALLGLRGAGKSTVGRAVAKRLGLPFIELDGRIEDAASLSLAEIFELQGEAYYRRLEREALKQVVASGEPAILATGGGIVTVAETYALLRRHCLTVWLRARPEDHWSRVARQGDRRPMAGDPKARQGLKRLLREREALYANASYNVATSGLTIDDVVGQVVELIRPPRPNHQPGPIPGSR